MKSICYIAIFFFLYLLLKHLMNNREYFTCDLNLNTYAKCFERHQARNVGKLKTANNGFSKLQPIIDKLKKNAVANMKNSKKNGELSGKLQDMAKGEAVENDPSVCEKYPSQC